MDEDGNPVLGPDGQPIVEIVNDLPASERFFAGGDTSVRGYALDRLGTPETIDRNGFPIGGNAVIVLNAELRVPVWRDIGVVGFVDAGNVFNRVERLRLRRDPADDRLRLALQVAHRTDSRGPWLQARSPDAARRQPRAADGAAHQPGAGVLMRRVRRALLALLLMAAAAASAEVIDRVMAIVDGHLITLSDVHRR